MSQNLSFALLFILFRHEPKPKPKLGHFILTKQALEFPFLKEVDIRVCPKMKAFIQHGTVSRSSLESVNNDDELKVVDTMFNSKWKSNNSTPEDAVKRVTKGQRSKTHGRIPRLLWGQKKKINASVCCEFALKIDEVRTNDNYIRVYETKVVELPFDDEDDYLMISEFLRRRRLLKEGITVPDNQELLPSTHNQSSSALNDGARTPTEREALMESKLLKETLKTSNVKLEELDGDDAYVVRQMVQLKSEDNNDKGVCKLNLPDSLDLASESPKATRRDGRFAEFSGTDTAKMSLQISNDSVDAHKVTTNMQINWTEGNMQMQNIEMINISKLEKRIILQDVNNNASESK
ncbi:hypothetical protein FXO38_12084 [Capsicum annuum]|nr:hypothetical protein FXO38_12084 [Capsicum annuum]KAF3662964.1 hypothetical protein FXO37_12227 [Capsicum annuum]